MLAFIEGILQESTPLKAIINLNGLGYEVHMPITTTEKLPALGKTVKLHTIVVYREDAHTLYGFFTKQERDFFKLLLEKVSGIGPKIALTILSKLSLPTLQKAIASSDISLLSQCPGIGKKTAERLVIELRDKVGNLGPSTLQSTPESPLASENERLSVFQDAVCALIALGFKPADADKSARKGLSSLPENASAESIIKKALNG